jgi:hypothetical protein
MFFYIDNKTSLNLTYDENGDKQIEYLKNYLQ